GGRLLIASLVGLSAVLLAKSLPETLHRAQIVYWQRACLQNVRPPTQIIHEADPVKAAKMVAADPRYVLHTTFFASGLRVSFAALDFKPWQGFQELVGGSAQSPPVYVHEIQNPDGIKLLVAVQADISPRTQNSTTAFFSYQVFEPGTVM